MLQTIGRIYVVGAVSVIVLFVYVCVLHNQVPISPFTQVALSAGALVASGTSRKAMLPEHKTIPGLLNPTHVRLYLSRGAYFVFWVALLLFIGLFLAGLVALGGPSQERAAAFVLLLSGWWFYEFYFAAALSFRGATSIRREVSCHESRKPPDA